MSDAPDIMSPLERDALQEIMNISFGQAAADLSDVIAQYVTLTVPYIDVMPFQAVYGRICEEITDVHDMSMITQFFSGKFSGSSILFFPHGEGKKLLRLFGENEVASCDNYDLDVLEKEGLVEISNIIIGACISKIAELLGDVVGYSPPRYFSKDQIFPSLKEALGGDDSFAIYFKTVFHFERFDASGYLFLVSDYTAMEWLKKAIAEYLEQYV